MRPHRRGDIGKNLESSGEWRTRQLSGEEHSRMREQPASPVTPRLACVSSVSNKATSPNKVGDRWSHWKLHWGEYLELFTLLVFSVSFCVLKGLHYLIEEDRPYTLSLWWLNVIHPRNSPRYNAFGFFFARQNHSVHLNVLLFFLFRTHMAVDLSLCRVFILLVGW